MEKQIILLSNANSYTDTLTSFYNSIPTHFLHQFTNWECCIDRLGIDLKLRNDACPIRDEVPCILQVNRYYLNKICKIELSSESIAIPADIFKYWHKFYLQELVSYNSNKLSKEFDDQVKSYVKINHDMFRGYFSKVTDGNISFGQFNYPFDNIEAQNYLDHSTYLCK